VAGIFSFEISSDGKYLFVGGIPSLVLMSFYKN
jgi:hypothetical protein